MAVVKVDFNVDRVKALLDNYKLLDNYHVSNSLGEDYYYTLDFIGINDKLEDTYARIEIFEKTNVFSDESYLITVDLANATLESSDTFGEISNIIRIANLVFRRELMASNQVIGTKLPLDVLAEKLFIIPKKDK